MTYRDELQAAMQRITTLEELAREHGERLEALDASFAPRPPERHRSSSPRPPSRTKRYLGFGAILLGVYPIWAMGAAHGTAAAHRRVPPPAPNREDKRERILFADPRAEAVRAAELASPVGRTDLGERGRATAQERTCRTFRKKSYLLAKVASKTASSDDLVTLNQICVLEGDRLCVSVINEASGHRTTP
ncbi:MAG: hypothetical protein AAGA56_05355 [Myxococcota bacterium]